MAAPLGSGEECALYELLCTLPAKYRIVLYLRYYEEYQVKEIASVLSITPNLVSARLLRRALLNQNQKQEREEFGDETGII